MKEQYKYNNSHVKEALNASNTPNNENFQDDLLVGLSYVPNLTEHAPNDHKHWDLQLDVYAWNQARILAKPGYRRKYQSGIKPPLNDGERVSNQLSQRGKSRIRKVANYYQLMTKQKNTKGYASMITLSYGAYFPTDKESKRHLDIFMKRFRRKVDKKDFHYMWVAERQKRGAIHYHILTPHYVEKEWVNNSWNQVVNSDFKRNDMHKHVQTLYPNVIGVFEAGAYMAKYLQKEGQNIMGNGYNMSQATSQGIKPIYQETIRFENRQTAKEVLLDILEANEHFNANLKIHDEGTHIVASIYNGFDREKMLKDWKDYSQVQIYNDDDIVECLESQLTYQGIPDS